MDLGFKPFAIDEPGPILLLVALLQVWSYPMHDPVMMDRGFLADRATTRKSFLHAAWLGVACILAFGLIGVDAGDTDREADLLADRAAGLAEQAHGAEAAGLEATVALLLFGGGDAAHVDHAADGVKDRTRHGSGRLV